MNLEDVHDADCVIVAVAHNEFKEMGLSGVMKLFVENEQKVLIDVKGLYSIQDLSTVNVLWWRL